jgi:hypothetical protein
LNFGGKLECWREDYLGYFRFSTSGDAISGDATSVYFRWRHDPPQIRPGWCFYTTYIFNEKIKIMKNVPVQAIFTGKNQWTQQCVYKMVTGSTENNGIFRVTVECLLSFKRCWYIPKAWLFERYDMRIFFHISTRTCSRPLRRKSLWYILDWIG